MAEHKMGQAVKATEDESSELTPSVAIPLSKNISVNKQFFSTLYQESSDVVFRSINVEKTEAIIIYIEGLADTPKLDQLVLETLLNYKAKTQSTHIHSKIEDNFLSSIKNNLPLSNIKEVSTFSSCTEEISNGYSILLLDGFDIALALTFPISRRLL